MKDHQHTVLLLTNHLGAGGAEQQLLALASGVDKQRFRVLVAVLYPGGPLEAEMKQIPGAELISLNRAGKYDFIPMFRVLQLLRQRKVNIVQPFLTPATLFGLFPALVTRTPVRVVTERCGLRRDTHLGFRLLRMAEDFLGRFASVGVANSCAGQRFLVERGYKPEKTRVIYNGLDLARLQVNPARAASIRAEKGLKPGEPVVGMSAWLTPAKDHSTFLKSACIIRERKPEVRFALLGDGPLRPHLEALVNELSLTEQVVFFGAQQEVGTYLSLFDVAVLSSKDHEGCSNSLLEAMALGKPVVATDIGGNKELVIAGETGLLVASGDPVALAEGVLSLLNAPERARQIGVKGRAMALSRFSQERMVADYQQLWLGFLHKRQTERLGPCPG